MSTTLPPVLDAHRQAAFVVMDWAGLTFEQAMADTVKSRVIECLAAQIRTREWKRTAQRTVVPVPRVRLGADGHPVGWCTQMVPGAHVVNPQVGFFNQPEGQQHP